MVIISLAIVSWQRYDTGEIGYRELTARWQAVFSNRDGASAYALFLQEAAMMPSDDTHAASHVIGSVLFDRYGLGGLRFCTGDFNYGCYHGFAGHVIEQQGLRGIEPLLEACEGFAPMSCQHGIGHGIMAYMGNDGLNDALVYCPAEDSGRCTSGVFMEYFLNTMNRADDRRILPFDPADPAAPCAIVKEQAYMGACYYGLPKLWRASISRTNPNITEQFALVGQYCEQVSDPDRKQLCFAGSGALAVPFANYDTEATLGLCEVMPEDGREACKEEAIHELPEKSSGPGI